MAMALEKEYLDLVLVPIGLLIMFAYHLFLLYRYLHHPLTTVMGYENQDKKVWVDKIMQADNKKQVDTALNVIASSTSAAIYLSTISLSFCSLIGAWIANSTSNFFPSDIIYGNTSQSIISIKYIGLLTCFLIAFSCFIHSARHFVHANYLISTPGDMVQVKKVEEEVIRGGEFWSLGLRALYFALNLLLWFFGPIPLFISSVIMVVILHYHDSKKPD
ncbi:uncharacterized protein LOC107411921 [Ziziphus jujuba]|nr:uncharacterized protein LOC107411921 [Ziziphus jujuba]